MYGIVTCDNSKNWHTLTLWSRHGFSSFNFHHSCSKELRIVEPWKCAVSSLIIVSWGWQSSWSCLFLTSSEGSISLRISRKGYKQGIRHCVTNEGSLFIEWWFCWWEMNRGEVLFLERQVHWSLKVWLIVYASSSFEIYQDIKGRDDSLFHLDKFYNCIPFGGQDWYFLHMLIGYQGTRGRWDTCQSATVLLLAPPWDDDLNEDRMIDLGLLHGWFSGVLVTAWSV